MASEPRLEEREPISPELVLVSPPDAARRAREELRESSFAHQTTPAIRDRSREERPLVAGAEPPRRRRRRIVLAGAALAATGVATALAAAGVATAYVVESREDAPPVAGLAPESAVQRTVPRAQRTTSSTANGSLLPHGRQTVKASRPPARERSSKRAAPTRTRTRTHGRTADAGFVPARTWTWPRRRGARAYVVQFVLKGHVRLQRRTTRPRLVLPHTFRFRAGTYRWTVQRVPPVADRRPIVSSRFVLTRAVAARANREALKRGPIR